MNKLCLFLVLGVFSFSSFSKTVRENEVARSQILVTLFNSVCMESFSDEENFTDFILGNNFEDLNEDNLDVVKVSSDKNPAGQKNQEKQQSHEGLTLSKIGKHYSIVNEGKKFFLDVTEDTCSVLVKNINQTVFNSQFKEFRKSIISDTVSENSNVFENRVGTTNYRLSSFQYYLQENGQPLPFQVFLAQTNAQKADYQIKLMLHIDKSGQDVIKKIGNKITEPI